MRKEFFDLRLCAELRCEMQAASALPGQVNREGVGRVDENMRRTSLRHVSPIVWSLVMERLLALKPALENHFGLKLQSYENLQFLTYDVGDFFVPHRDGSKAADADKRLRSRKVSLVIFLNDQSSEVCEGCYCGGALTLYGLMSDGRMAQYGFPLAGQTGMLVAFRSLTTHEVRPVTYGERYSIVTWLS